MSKKTGNDTRTGVVVEILNERVDQCKTNQAVILTAIPAEPRGACVPVHTQFLPGGKINNEYLCKYPDGSTSWVDGKHIFIHNR